MTARRPRFQRYTDAERKAALRKYRKARAAGKSPTAAARSAGTDIAVIERWEDEAATPVKFTPRDRACLGCSITFRSAHPGNRLCPKCSGAIAALPAAWSA